MLTCKDCGFDNIEEALFCQQCGAPLRETRQEAKREESPEENEEVSLWGRSSEEETAEPQTETPPADAADGEADVPVDAAPVMPKKKRKRWIPFAVLGGVLVLAAAVLLIIRSASDPLKTAKKFMTAMDNKDTNKILKICDCPDVELTEESLKPMFELYASDQDFKEELAELLKADVERIREGKHPNVGDMVNLTWEKGFPADRYRVRLGSAGVTISSNLPGVEIAWNGGSLKLKDGEYEGRAVDLLPGSYQFSGVYTVGDSGETLKAETEERITDYLSSAELKFECMDLNIWLPSELILNRVMIGGKECKSLNKGEGCYSVFPAFPDKDITIEAKNERGTVLSETFKIPAGYSLDTYDYQSTLSTLSFMLSWPAVLELEAVTVNGQPVDLSDRIGEILVIDGVSPGENVVMKAKTPWGETVEDSFTAEGSSSDGLILHDWEYTMSETARDEIASAAGRFFLEALNAYNGEDRETLEQLSDDFKNEFASTLLFLFNGREEEETYFSYQPIRVAADKSGINRIADSFRVDVAGECDSFLYSKSEKTGKWKKGEKAPYTLSGSFTVGYNTETGNWEVTEGYMTYLTIEDLKQPVEIPVAK